MLKLKSEAQELDSQCQGMRRDTKRLLALARTGLIDSPREEVFDRFADLAAKLLNTPITIISLMDGDKQFFKASHGLPPDLEAARELPLDASICQYTLIGKPFIVPDARVHPLLEKHPVTVNFGVKGFISYPLVTPQGDSLGAFCAIDMQPREWTKDEMMTLEQLTNAMMAEITLRGVVKDLEKEIQQKERFVATLMHDLRSPLATAQMALSAMEDKSAGDSILITMAQQNLVRVDDMIHEMLDAARARAGELPAILKENFDLREMIKDTLSDMAGLHGNRFKLHAPDPLLGRWSRGGLRRLMENLLNNAAKYGKAGTEISVSAVKDETNSRIQISVHNQGPALAQSERDKIFMAFERSSAAQNGQRKGWGLGLAQVQDMVTAHNGQLELRSEEGHGTTFIVSLPKNQIL